MDYKVVGMFQVCKIKVFKGVGPQEYVEEGAEEQGYPQYKRGQGHVRSWKVLTAIGKCHILTAWYIVH